MEISEGEWEASRGRAAWVGEGIGEGRGVVTILGGGKLMNKGCFGGGLSMGLSGMIGRLASAAAGCEGEGCRCIGLTLSQDTM